MLVLPKGVRHIPGHLDRDEQQGLLVEDIRAVVGRLRSTARKCRAPASP
jgi:hypothetical protein